MEGLLHWIGWYQFPIYTIQPNGERTVEWTEKIVNYDDNLLMTQLKDGYVVWHDPVYYGRKQENVFNGVTFYGTIRVAKRNVDKQYIKFSL